jgi:5-methylcytosine-specific restriction endonuclease McrA
MTRTARLEFSRKVRKAIIDRATKHGMIRCEKCTQYCFAKFEIDHILPAELGGTADITNGMLLCLQCHKEKTAEDIRRIRKADRQRDRQTGAIVAKGRIRSAGFPKRAPRAAKPSLPPRLLYARVGELKMPIGDNPEIEGD